MNRKESATRILFIFDDEASFQIWKCMANVIEQLPPVELFLALDATEGLSMLEYVHPDVVVIDNNMSEERDMFIDSLSTDHPPILIQVDDSSKLGNTFHGKEVIYIERNGSLEGIHKTLLVAASAAENNELKLSTILQVH
jgi:DNA-binding NarL/FixJ family response regulator